ncbi:MAG: class I SAM-dependent methyltransferase [Microgenomates group bacterium]
MAKLREKIAPFRFGLAAKEIIRSLNLEGKEKILEIGSGLGLLGQEIKKRIGTKTFYVGIDLAFNPLEKSKDREILPVQGNAIKLPFTDEAFDVVISTDVLEHIPNAEEVIKEIRRVLKPGGKAFIVIADPSEPRFENVVDHIKRSQSASDVPLGKSFSKKWFYYSSRVPKISPERLAKNFQSSIFSKITQ